MPRQLRAFQLCLGHKNRKERDRNISDTRGHCRARRLFNERGMPYRRFPFRTIVVGIRERCLEMTER